MSDRHRWLVAGLWVKCTVLVCAGITAALAGDGRVSDEESSWSLIAFVFPIAAFAGVGGMIVLRRPGNRIGWLLTAIGLLFAIVVACSGIAVWANVTGALPTGVAGWIGVGANAWVVGLGLIGTQLPLRLPDGELPSPAWRWFSRISIFLIAVALVGMAIQPEASDDAPFPANPVAVESLKWLGAAFGGVLICFFIALVALVRRYRSSDVHEREQLRWIAFGGVLFFVVYFVTLPLASALGETTTAADVLTSISQAAFGALPIAIGYAVLKHRLYGIEGVISRALVYGALTALLAATYLALVVLIGLAVGESDLAIAASTLVVAALFRPARARIQALVDRRFYRRRYDATRTLEAFSGRLRDELDLEALGADLRGVVHQTVQPAHVSLWLRSEA